MLRPPASLLALSLTGAALLAAPRPARADAEVSTGAAYGIAAGELATAGVFALHFGTRLGPTGGAGMIVNFTPMVVAPLAGWGAHAGDLDPRPALALHGAAWLGADLFLLGALIDGRDQNWRMRAGPTAWALGAAGAIAGGVLGATQVHDADDQIAFSALPVAGFVVGGLLIGGPLALATDGGDAAVSRLGTGALIGTSLGFAAWAVLATRDDDGGDAATPRTLPSASLGGGPGRRFMVSLGGAF